MSYRQYAKHRDCSLSYVTQAIKKGWIQTAKVDSVIKIDQEKADKDWIANSGIVTETGENVAYNNNSDVPALAESRAIKEDYIAKIKKLDYEKAKEILVEKDKIQKVMRELAYSVRERLRTIPQKVSAELAAENDPRKLEIILQKEIDDALERLQSIKMSFL